MDTHIPMWRGGFKRIEDVRQGDFVIDERGSKTKVVGTSQIYKNHECYKITFSDNTSVVCDAGHLWTVEDKSFRKGISRNKKIFPQRKTVTTEQISKGVSIYSKENAYAVGTCDPVKYRKRSLRVDPYVLGQWLGDGTSVCANLTTTDDEFVSSEFSRRGYILRKTNQPIIFKIEMQGDTHSTGRQKSIQHILRSLDLLGHKRIPENYLFSSVQQRTDLVCGLMDADGYASKEGHCEYLSTDKGLAIDFRTLIASLGIKSTMYEYDAKIYGRVVSKKYRVKFTTDYPVFLLPRKLSRLHPITRPWQKRRYITSCEKVPSVHVKCLMVDSPNHLYLCTESYIPTHNSYFASAEIWAMCEDVRMIQNRPARGWVVAPTYQLTMEMWRYACYILQDLITEKTESKKRIILYGGHEIEFKSADDKDANLRGAGLDFVIVDEAARVSRQAWEEGLRPAIADRQGRALFISTPKGRNYFYDLFAMGQDPKQSDIASWKLPTNTSPLFPPKEWETLRRTTPELVFRQEFMAEFLEDSSTVFRNIGRCVWGDFEEPKPGHQYAIGVDLAKTYDFTVIFVLDMTEKHIVFFDRFQHLDWNLQKEKIIWNAKRYNNAFICIDSTGVGDPIEADLTRARLKVFGYKFTNISKKELIELGIIALEQRWVTYPHIPEFMNEMMAFEYEVLPSGKVRYQAPEGIHDDCVIAFCLALIPFRDLVYKKPPLPDPLKEKLDDRSYEFWARHQENKKMLQKEGRTEFNIDEV